MYIEPNTTIRLLSNVPLDNNYDDTLFFSSELVQRQTFLGFPAYVYNNNTYQRVNKNKIRLTVNNAYIYNCNYLMFQNTSYENKWFYAFITQIDYINNGVYEISYEIDVIQTWFFETELEPSYVERETSATDIIGENIAPEPVDLGPIICSSMETDTHFNQYAIVIARANRTNTGG